MEFFNQLTNYYIKINKGVAVFLLIVIFIVGLVSLFNTNFWVGPLIWIIGSVLVILVFGFLAMVIEMHRNLENIDKILTNIDEKSDSKKERKRQRPEKDAFVKRYGDRADELGPNTSRVRKESEDRLRKCYEDCHNFIDNRLVTASGTLLPVFHGEKDMKIKGLFSSMMSMWDVHDESLKPDEYLIGFKDSGFDEQTTAYPDLD